MHRTTATALTLALSALILAGCAGADAGADAAVRVDTLADGSVHVMNPAERREAWQVREVKRIGAFDGGGAYEFVHVAALVVHGSRAAR